MFDEREKDGKKERLAIASPQARRVETIGKSRIKTYPRRVGGTEKKRNQSPLDGC